MDGLDKRGIFESTSNIDKKMPRKNGIRGLTEALPVQTGSRGQ